jgi:hypothetical protein
MLDPAVALRFNPDEGTVIRTPPGAGYGNWVGGKVSYDDGPGTFALFYRERRPLEQGRAGECAVAVSDDGVAFTDVWKATKAELAANSIEEGHCVRHRDEWRLYLSYEMVGTSIWRIDLITASSPELFDAQSRRTVLWPGDYGLGWIKDPFVMNREGAWWVYSAVASRSDPQRDGDSIVAGPLDATVLAVSEDGRYFPDMEYVFEAPADDSWHGRRARINSVIPWESGFLAFFDGGRTFYDNYEEKAGLATSPDGRSFTRLDTGSPWVSSRHGGVRYVCAVPVEDEVFFYYEYTLGDGSHDLRMSRVAVDASV